MKYFAGILSIVFLAGCSVAPAVQEHMIIVPTAIVFTSVASDSTISITHSCTCPFTWRDSVYPAVSWLTFPTYQSGDKGDVPIAIDTAQLPSDTNRATILIISNSYGVDSIHVTAIK